MKKGTESICNVSEFIAKLNEKADKVIKAKGEKKSRKPKKWVEETLQESCVKWFDFVYPDLKLLLHHSPNEGRRSVIEGTHLKASGMRKGFPDLVLLMPSGAYHWLAMEFKSEKGRPTEEQKEYADYLTTHGVLHKYIRTFTEFEELIKEYVKKGE